MPDLLRWNWQQRDWPDSRFDAERLAALEEKFLREAGFYLGTFTHLVDEKRDSLAVEMMSEEALKTSEIEARF